MFHNFLDHTLLWGICGVSQFLFIVSINVENAFLAIMCAHRLSFLLVRKIPRSSTPIPALRGERAGAETVSYRARLLRGGSLVAHCFGHVVTSSCITLIMPLTAGVASTALFCSCYRLDWGGVRDPSRWPH